MESERQLLRTALCARVRGLCACLRFVQLRDAWLSQLHLAGAYRKCAACPRAWFGVLRVSPSESTLPFGVYLLLSSSHSRTELALSLGALYLLRLCPSPPNTSASPPVFGPCSPDSVQAPSKPLCGPLKDWLLAQSAWSCPSHSRLCGAAQRTGRNSGLCIETGTFKNTVEELQWAL